MCNFVNLKSIIKLNLIYLHKNMDLYKHLEKCLQYLLKYIMYINFKIVSSKFWMPDA